MKESSSLLEVMSPTQLCLELLKVSGGIAVPGSLRWGTVSHTVLSFRMGWHMVGEGFKVGMGLYSTYFMTTNPIFKSITFNLCNSLV